MRINVKIKIIKKVELINRNPSMLNLLIINILIIFEILLKFLAKNGCSNSPCLNGATCTNINNNQSYSCNCLAGYSGSNCQTCIHDNHLYL